MDKTKWTYINMYINMGGLRTILGGGVGQYKKIFKIEAKKSFNVISTYKCKQVYAIMLSINNSYLYSESF